MRPAALMRLWFAALAGLAGARAAESGRAVPAHPLRWDAREKALAATPGDDVAEFEFTVRSTASAPVEINEERADTPMPAFAAQHGGPLTSEQIESLVTCALRHFPTLAAAP